jgi:hypothetical protein
MKGCSRIDLIRLGEHAVYNNLTKSKLLIMRSGFCGNRARASRDLGRASARYTYIIIGLGLGLITTINVGGLGVYKG